MLTEALRAGAVPAAGADDDVDHIGQHGLLARPRVLGAEGALQALGLPEAPRLLEDDIRLALLGGGDAVLLGSQPDELARQRRREPHVEGILPGQRRDDLVLGLSQAVLLVAQIVQDPFGGPLHLLLNVEKPTHLVNAHSFTRLLTIGRTPP